METLLRKNNGVWCMLIPFSSLLICHSCNCTELNFSYHDSESTEVHTCYTSEKKTNCKQNAFFPMPMSPCNCSPLGLWLEWRATSVKTSRAKCACTFSLQIQIYMYALLQTIEDLVDMDASSFQAQICHCLFPSSSFLFPLFSPPLFFPSILLSLIPAQSHWSLHQQPLARWDVNGECLKMLQWRLW